MIRALAISIGVAVLLASGAALAKTRVAIVAFEGDDDGAVQEVVADLLDGDYTVSGAKTVNRTIDKLGFDSNLSDKDLKKLANELDVDAILRGDLSRKGTRKLLHVKVYLNGKKVRGFKVEFASINSEKFKSALKDKIDEKLSGQAPKKAVEEAAPASDEEDPIGGAKKTKKTAKADKAEMPKEPAEKQAKDEGGEDTENADKEEASDEKSADDEDGARKATKETAAADVDDEEVGVSASVTVGSSSSGRSASRLAIRVDVGPSFSSRTLKFNSRAFEEAPKTYQNAPVGGMRVGGELYPLAFGNPNSFMSGLGIAGHYDQTLKLNLQSTAQPGTKFPVTQKNWEIGARFRIAFGSSAKAPTVTLRGGYFHRMFKVDRTALMEGNLIDLPDVFYRGFDPGLEFRIPILKQVALVFGGEAVLVTNTGQIQKLYSYGQAKVIGGQGMAGIDVVIAGRVALRVTGEMSQFGFTFSGNGAQTYNRDNDPSTPDVGGALDRYIGGSASLAVLY
jgi:hypothetical protein